VVLKDGTDKEGRISAVSQKLAKIGEILDAPSEDIAGAVRTAVEAIGRVHFVPMVRQRVSIVSDELMPEGGKYRWERETGLPLDIRLNPKNDHLELTAVLEIGHLLDHQAIGMPGKFASVGHPNLEDWRRAIDSSRCLQKLEDLRAAGAIPYRFADGLIRNVNVGRIAGYLLEPPELFSRSYAQFIVEQSGHDALTAQLHGFNRVENPSSVVPYYWHDDDFAPIAAAFGRLIIELGWKR
jgi:hypothetical protein